MKKINLPITPFLAVGLLSLAPLAALAAEVPATGVTTTAQAAHNSAVTGKILTLTPDSIEIKGHQGTTQSFVINSETKYGSAEKAETYQNLKQGQHVRVAFVEENGKQVATAIKELPRHHHGKG